MASVQRELVCSGAFVAYGDDFDRLRLIILWTANDAKVPKWQLQQVGCVLQEETRSY